MLIGLSNSSLGLSLAVLRAWVIFFIIIASSYDQLVGLKYIQLFMLMLIVLVWRFKTNSLLGFYYLFERALLPIFLMVIGWGYQPERLLASVNLFLYTVLASLPLLFCVLVVSQPLYFSNFNDLPRINNLNRTDSLINGIITTSLLAGFMVKYPLFSVHLWLPKAHVEAPVAGSIVLAAILLKLGGYGLLRLSPLLTPLSPIVLSLISFSLIGGALISSLCLRQTDIKVLIAYSSVAHISIVISASLTHTYIGLIGAYLIMIAHGVASSGIFRGANVSYMRWKTRNILISKRILNYMPVFTLWWFLLCVCNMGAPPSLNLIREIVSIISLINIIRALIAPLRLVAGLAVAYTLLLYASAQQGQSRFRKPRSNMVSLRENTLMFSHVFVAIRIRLVISFVI